MKTFYVREAKSQEGTVVVSFFLLTSKQTRQRRNGAEYLQLGFMDRTGQLPGKLWQNLEMAADLEVEDAVKVQARVGNYQGRFELVVEKIRRAENSEFDLADLLPTTEEDVEKLWAELQQHVASVKDDTLRRLLETVLTDPDTAERFKKAPAAKIFHHPFLGGLMEHVVSLCRLCNLAHHNYGWIERDLLLAAAVLHDIGKIHELSYDRTIEYTDAGKLLGHITIGVKILHQAIAKSPVSPQLEQILTHLILSHHGELEYGSPVEPAMAAAHLFHMLDNLDARMAAIRMVLDLPDDGSNWSEPVTSLRKPVLRVGKYTNTPEATAGSREPQNS